MADEEPSKTTPIHCASSIVDAKKKAKIKAKKKYLPREKPALFDTCGKVEGIWLDRAVSDGFLYLRGDTKAVSNGTEYTQLP